MDRPHGLIFCNVIVPVCRQEMVQDEFAGWYKMRREVASMLEKHSEKSRASIDKGYIFYSDFWLSTQRILSSVQSLYKSWHNTKKTSHYLTQNDTSEYQFEWTLNQFGCVSICTSGFVLQATVLTEEINCRSLSVYTESMALLYVQTMLQLHLSLYCLCKQKMDQALTYASRASRSGLYCLRNFVNRQRKCYDLDMRCITPFYATETCWKLWFSALIVSQVRYCISLQPYTSFSVTYYYDSQHLLQTCLSYIPHFMITPNHNSELLYQSKARSEIILISIGAKLAEYATPRNDASSIQVAINILEQFGDDNEKQLRQDMTNYYQTLVGRSPTQMTLKCEVHRIVVEVNKPNALWENYVLHVPCGAMATN